MPEQKLLENLTQAVSEAVKVYWSTRESQTQKQKATGGADQGFRSAVTGGAQMNGFVQLITNLVIEAGVDRSAVHYDESLELPGYFRPTKRWDLVVVVDGRLIAAFEAKSQVGSFGNNFNNRTEEAMGSALDLWTAFREKAFKSSIRPLLGYLFLLEDCPASKKPVGAKEPHFKVFPEFRNSSYAQRYALFCQRLVLERQYDVAAFLMSDRVNGTKGNYSEPVPDLSFQKFANALVAHVAAQTGKIRKL
jgi:Restriction endonuclease XhoI